MQRVWGDFTDAVTGLHSIPIGVNAAGTEVAGDVIFKSAFTFPFDQDVTLTRAFLTYQFRPLPGDAAAVAIGMAIVSPGSSIGDLNPATDAGWDGWMLHRWLQILDTPVAQSPASGRPFPASSVDDMTGSIDVKAKRKIPQGSSVIFSFAVEFLGNATAGSWNFDFGGRALTLEK